MKRTLLVVFINLILLLFYCTSYCQEQDNPVDKSFSIQNFTPSVNPFGTFSIDSARTIGHLAFTAGFWLDYQNNPLVIYNCEINESGDCILDSDNPRSVVVRNHLEGNITGTITLFNRLMIGLLLPVNFYMNGDGVDPETGKGVDGGLSSNFGLGDLHLIVQGRIWGGENDNNGLAISGQVDLTVPTGDLAVSDAFMGDGFLTVQPKLLLDFKWNNLYLAARVGYMWREDSVMFSTEVGHQMTYAFGASYLFLDRYKAIVEIFGSNGFTTQLDETPLEVVLGGEVRLGDFLIRAGAGTGIIEASGVPLFRVFAGGGWAPLMTDRDGDGVLDSDDECPLEVEDRDNFQDDDGCPDPDNDHDRFLDERDRCPDQAEDRDNFQDEDGCPDRDNDNDGVQDGYDACPMEPEDRDNFQDNDGCPDLDHDGDNISIPDDQCPEEAEDTDGFCDNDGCPEEDCDNDAIIDDNDQCPDQAEDRDNFQDEDGCLDTDNDNDGFPDTADRCPDRPENLNGVRDDDGCPDVGQSLVIITAEQLEIKQQIRFETDSDKIIGKVSFEILNIVTDILKRNPIYKIRIEGHTDTKGTREHNLDLSKRRAESVKRYLVEHGIEEARLEAEGYGPDRPIADNSTREGRAENRRVEFHITFPIPQPPPPPPVENPSGENEGGEMMIIEDSGGDSQQNQAPPEGGGDTMVFDEGGSGQQQTPQQNQQQQQQPEGDGEVMVFQ